MKKIILSLALLAFVSASTISAVMSANGIETQKQDDKKKKSGDKSENKDKAWNGAYIVRQEKDDKQEYKTNIYPYHRLLGFVRLIEFLPILRMQPSS